MADMSSLVQESLSVSGILLGKTMGRGVELADRFDRESENLADLEVRSRMAGRWMMAAIQTSFAVMPALVYLFAGLAPGAASIGTIVAFTTLQTRLFFPVQSLLSVGVDIQTSTALFDRVFEYLDLDVDIEPGTRALSDVSRRGPLRRRVVQVRRRVDAARRRRDRPAGTRTALVGETGAGKTTLGYLAARLYDPERGGVTIDGVDLRELTFDALAERRRRRLAGDLPVPRVGAREPALRAAGRHRRGDRGRRPRGPDPRDDRGAARRLRHGRRRARLPLLRRREAADRDRPHGPAQPAGAGARRGDLARSTSRPSAPSARRSRSSPRAARRSSSRTGSRPSATPTRSSCSTAARSPSAARTRSCSRSAAATPRSSLATKAARRRRAPRARLRRA